MAIISNVSREVYFLFFPTDSVLWALAPYLRGPTPTLYIVVKMKPTESFPYFNNRFIDIETSSGCNFMPVSYTHLDVYKRQGNGSGEMWSVEPLKK